MVVGGGIVGLATAYRLGERFPGARITVLEKEAAVGRHQTGHNSGVLHCGLYYKPGSMKARLAVHRHPPDGGILPARTASRTKSAASWWWPPTKAKCRGCASSKSAAPPTVWKACAGSSREEMREIEPHVGGVAALRVPQEGIVDYRRRLRGAGAAAWRSAACAWSPARACTALRQPSGEWIAETAAGEFTADFLINCAGLHCDRVAELAGERREVRILPFRGEYYKIRPERQYLVRNLIYPVPDPRFPFLGVHFTRLIHGGIEAGPNAVLAFAREGYRKTDINLRDLFDALTYGGFWRFLRALSLHGLVRTAPLLQPRAVLPVAAAPGAGNPARTIWPPAAPACARRPSRRQAKWCRTSSFSRAPTPCTC